ncbi:MAG TPA: thermonuclease family protein [Acidimicrobiia bacterium]|nr:thermonuclease family protein [Acidimicrobiia bacterium]
MSKRWWGALALVVVATACATTDPESSVDTSRPPATDAPPASTAPTSRPDVTATIPSTVPPTSSTSAPRALPAGDDTTVERVVDGDTIVVAGGERVRLIGIDTPESVDPRRSVECFGKEASRRTGELLPAGTAVRLAYDVERYDRYDRTLAYVYRRADARFVNEVLVREGYALAYTYPPNVAHADDFVRWQREARDAGRGLWAACPVDEPAPVPVAPGGGGGCDAAYPDVCIPPPPPDLDCRDVTPRRFRVVPPDPHRFDGDADGLGCE